MILSDGSIRANIESSHIGLSPYNPALVQPASIDLRLGRSFQVCVAEQTQGPLDLSKPIELPPYVEHICESFILLPGEFILGCTMEHIKLPADIQATVCGKSSLGRLGLFVENAGFVDPGFNGFLTLELFNASKTPLKLCAGMRIAQLSFNRLDTPCQRPYGAPELGSHYQNQTGATVSRWEPR